LQQVSEPLDASTVGLFVCLFVFCGAAAQYGPRPHHFWGFLITHDDASQSVGPLRTSDQLVAETSTWQHTTLTTDKHSWPWWDSNPRSQQESGRRASTVGTDWNLQCMRVFHLIQHICGHTLPCNFETSVAMSI
jgi:hypothetical protein